jgi:hypothetical protein
MLKMLRYTYGQMLQKQHYLSWNAHFESFAVHARNLVNFLTDNDTGNFKASEFAQAYKAKIGDCQGAMTKLLSQVFHLGKKRPRDVVGKFNTQHAKQVRDWIEKNFADFLNKLSGEQRALFNEDKADPTKDEATYITTGPTGPGAYACTASLAVQTHSTSDDMGIAIRKITDRKPK